MRTKDDIMKQVGMTAEYNPRGGIIPDLADVLMIEVLVDIRDVLTEQIAKFEIIEVLFAKLHEAGIELG